MGSPHEITHLRFLAQYIMNPYVYPSGSGRGAPSDAMRAHADAIRALEQPSWLTKAQIDVLYFPFAL